MLLTTAAAAAATATATAAAAAAAAAAHHYLEELPLITCHWHYPPPPIDRQVLEERARAFSRDDKQQAGEVDEADVQSKGPVLRPAKSKSAHALQFYLTPPEKGEGEGAGTGAGAGAGAGTDPPRGTTGARPSAGIAIGALVASTAVHEEPTRGVSRCAKGKALRRGSL